MAKLKKSPDAEAPVPVRVKPGKPAKTLPALRGSIYSVNGKLLAKSSTVWNLSLIHILIGTVVMRLSYNG